MNLRPSAASSYHIQTQRFSLRFPSDLALSARGLVRRAFLSVELILSGLRASC